MIQDLDGFLAQIASDVEALLSMHPVLLGEASPPNVGGVYALSVENQIVYVGEAKGAKGLRDRLLRKHISGDDGHAIQRELSNAFPNRIARRRHIKSTVSVRWVAIDDPDQISAVERTAIWLLRPKWNKK